MPRFATPLPIALAAAALFASAPAYAAACSTAPITADTTHSVTCTATAATKLGGAQQPTLTFTPGASWSSSKNAFDFVGNARVVNNGTIDSTGGRALRDDTGGLTLGITNAAGAVISSSKDDAIQMSVTGSNVTLDNAGTVISTSARALNWNALQTGTNTLNNAATGRLTATQDDAVRLGAGGVVVNAGVIEATGGGGRGISGKSKNAISDRMDITNTGTGRILGASHGITGGDGNTAVSANPNVTMRITNQAGGLIRGNDGAGVNVDGFSAQEKVTIRNDGDIIGNGVTADGDGVDVDGLVDITNTGRIASLAAKGDVSEGITAGGGTVVNSGVIEGLNPGGAGRGITFAGVDKDQAGNAIAVQPIYADTRITNTGTIRGASDSAIAFTSALATPFTATIDNQAGGVIEGLGATAAAIATGATATTITTAGTLRAPTSGVAVDFAGSAGSLTITAGQVQGDVRGAAGTQTIALRGGTLTGTIAPGAGDDSATLTGGAIVGAVRMGAGSDTAAVGAAVDVSQLTALAGDDAQRDPAAANTLQLDASLTGASTVAGAAGNTAITGWDTLNLGNGSATPRLALTGDLATGAATGRMAIAQQATLALAAGTIAARVGYTVANAGTVALQNGAVGDVLTVQGDYAATGAAALTLDACLGSAAQADLLVVQGAASGSTTLAITPAAGATCAGAATSGNGIEVVRTGGGAGTFALAGGSVTQGGFRYALAQVGSSWYLQATPVAPANPGTPGNPGTPSNPATPGAAAVQPVPADAPWSLALLGAAVALVARRLQRAGRLGRSLR